MTPPIYDAQTLLFEMAAVWRLVVHSCAADEAEAIVQEVYMRAFDAIDRVPVDCQGGARHWLFRITCEVLDGRTHGAVSRPTGPGLRGPVPDDSIDQHLQQAICELPMGERIVFLLSVVERLRYEEIAVILKISAAEVVVRLDSARRRLRPPPGPESSSQ